MVKLKPWFTIRDCGGFLFTKFLLGICPVLWHHLDPMILWITFPCRFFIRAALIWKTFVFCGFSRRNRQGFLRDNSPRIKSKGVVLKHFSSTTPWEFLPRALPASSLLIAYRKTEEDIIISSLFSLGEHKIAQWMWLTESW